MASMEDSSDSEVEHKFKTVHEQQKSPVPCSSKMSEKLSILDHDSSDSEVEFKINKNYAVRYNEWRGKEELQKYKDLKKKDDDSESSSESDEEIPEFDEEFFRALSLLKGKDPRIFDKNYELFTDKEVKKTKAFKEKPMFMKDYERSLVLERGGKFSDEEDEEMTTKKFTYNEELENLKKPFTEILKESDDEDNDLLNVKTKTKTEEEDEEADYLKWLKGEEKEVSEDIKKDMSHLRDFWNDPKLDEGEKFLRDYILNKRYLEKDDSEIPSYEEITSGMLSDDEKIIDEQEKFEHKYNFRFEEPDEEFIKRYPRTIGDSLRKTDNRRKQKRDEKAERRRIEREQRKEELKRLKAFKRKEIEEKFSKLKDIAGQELNLNESDLESDFDPDKHEQKMRQMFNDDYYGVEEEQKPEFPYDDELDSENWNAWSGEKIVSDSDEDEKDDKQGIVKIELQENTTNPKEDFMQEMIAAAQPKKKMKKKSLFAKVVSQPKPIYDPDGKSFDDYLDEYYKLDYEDVIGDMPVRYKYRKVIPNNFGLTVEEILVADDKELNRWCSVKKTCQYRNDDEEIYDVQAYKKKAQNPVAKKKVLSSLFMPKDVDNDINANNSEQPITKGKTNKNSNVLEHGSLEDGENIDNLEHGVDDQNSHVLTKQTKKKRKRDLEGIQVNTNSENVKDLSDSNQVNTNIEKDYVPLSKKHKKKIKMEMADSSDYLIDEPAKSKKRKNENIGNEALGFEDHASDGNVAKKNKLKPDFNKSDSVSSYSNTISAENSSQEPKKKKKKKKKKNSVPVVTDNSQNIIFHKPLDVEPINNNIDREADSSDCVIDEPAKSKKRKNENFGNGALGFEDRASEGNVVKKKNKLKPDFNKSDSVSFYTNTISAENSSQEPKKKKKKKKRKKKKSVPVTDNSQNIVFHNKKSKNKNQTQVPSGDKRLGLSDERLAAYGINPKKFKNKILYSKK